MHNHASQAGNGCFHRKQSVTERIGKPVSDALPAIYGVFARRSFLFPRTGLNVVEFWGHMPATPGTLNPSSPRMAAKNLRPTHGISVGPTGEGLWSFWKRIMVGSVEVPFFSVSFSLPLVRRGPQGCRRVNEKSRKKKGLCRANAHLGFSNRLLLAAFLPPGSVTCSIFSGEKDLLCECTVVRSVPPQKFTGFFSHRKNKLHCRTLIFHPSEALEVRTRWQSFNSNRYLIQKL